MSRLSTIRAYFNKDPDATNAEDHELVAARALLGEPDIVLDELRQGMREDVASRLAPTLRGYSDELAHRKAEYDSKNEGQAVPPYALRYEKFPKGSMTRAMILFNLWAMEMTDGCSGGCSFCSICAVPVHPRKLDTIPEPQLEAMCDEIFDLVGELTKNPKLQIGALQRLCNYLATDSGDYLFLRKFLEYLAKKGVSKVFLSSILPEHNRETLEEIMEHLQLKEKIERLNRLDENFNRTRKILIERFPECGDLSFTQAKETLEHYKKLLQLLDIINSLTAYVEMEFGDKTLAEISGMSFKGFSSLDIIPAVIDQSKTVREIIEDLSAQAQRELDQTGMNDHGLKDLIFDMSFERRRQNLRFEKEFELGQYKDNPALDIDARRKALREYQDKMQAIYQAVLEEIPEPESAKRLGLAFQIYKIVNETIKTYDPILGELGEPPASEFEKKENRQEIVAARIRELEGRLKKYPEDLVFRVSKIPGRAEYIDGLGLPSRHTAVLYAESRGKMDYSFQNIGRSFSPPAISIEEYRMGIVVTPYGVENTILVRPGVDCTTGLLRVPFYRFLDDPKPLASGTHLYDVLPHVIVVMSKKMREKDFFFAFDGKGVRKITFDTTTYTVVSDEILPGLEKIRSLDDIRRLFKFRGTLLPKCAECKDCFGIVPKKPEEIAA